MRKIKTVCLAIFLIGIQCVYAQNKHIKIETSKGNIVIELFEKEAPETVKNFLSYIESGAYKGTIFHRVIQNFMIQGGGLLPNMQSIETQIPIVNESHNNLSNTKGTIAMARTPQPHSATSQFFINLVDNHFLDKKNSRDGYGYCVFGNVTQGMDVVEKIGKVQTTEKKGFKDVPVKSVVIQNIEIL